MILTTIGIMATTGAIVTSTQTGLQPMNVVQMNNNEAKITVAKDMDLNFNTPKTIELTAVGNRQVKQNGINEKFTIHAKAGSTTYLYYQTGYKNIQQFNVNGYKIATGLVNN